MCGFVTFFSNSSISEESKESLRDMRRIIKHRGPTQDGEYMDDHVYLGFKRLSILDLANGLQPFSYKDELEVVFNGEIYNYISLRNELINEGYEFKTKSEVEVIATLYSKLGDKFVEKLRGMFSFIIWDRKKNTLLGGRDPFGIKPFYYIENETGLYIASELKSFHMNPDSTYTEIDEEALHNYLTFQFVPEPNTLLKDVKVLKPGHIIKKELGKKHEIDCYYTIKFNPTPGSKDEKMEEIRKVLEDSVALHMQSEVPVASFLSGGIDSTVVTALAKKHMPDLKTFTIGFERKGYSEIDLAKESADKLGLENISKIISHEEFANELPKIIWHMDEPVADPAAIPLYFIAKEAAKHVTVILSGEGADEVFGGYTIYHEPNSLKMFDYVPGFMKKALKSGASLVPQGTKGKSFIERGCTPMVERYVGNAKIFLDNEKPEILKKCNSKYTIRKAMTDIYDRAEPYDPITKMQFVDFNTWLTGDILVKADRMTMAHALELRVPFLDKEVFRVASKLTPDEKINGHVTKYLLRESFKSELPFLTALDRKKLGYPVPIRLWLKDELYDWAMNIIKDSNADEYINKEVAMKLVEDHRKGPFDLSRKIWTILIFLIWHKIYIEKVTPFLELENKQ
ncbi:asparagine synthase (glutamine-hydrolyzing) [Clostridium culturomicium]|uniref:asparagine synthase (glutamine-hydrolyzing) n=1 Tax=Clostridium culturomicium TaxID=1499683 RepID=UPI003857C4EE